MRKKISKLVVDEEGPSAKELYSREVKNYLENHRNEFLDKLAKLCKETSGRIAYRDILVALGTDFPKASWIDKGDNCKQVVQFFCEIGFIYGYDENYLYFP